MGLPLGTDGIVGMGWLGLCGAPAWVSGFPALLSEAGWDLCWAGVGEEWHALAAHRDAELTLEN
jgi:hypothetical protein